MNEPYRGLQPYREEDGEYFVGRENESSSLAANALTAPITVFLGASGVGKSSILLAGVMPILKKEPHAIPVVFREWHDLRFRQSLLQRIVQTAMRTPKSEATLILIFDQFEEYFLYNPDPQSPFDAELARIINDHRLDLNVVFSMRDDSLAMLGRLQKRIPSILQNCFRVDHLDRAAAKEAIERPLARFAELRGEKPMAIEPELTATILDELDARRWPGGGEIAESATRSGSGTAITRRVATPYLQIVMTRLWNDARARRTGMSVAQLKKLGGTETIVKNHVDGVMESLTVPERRLCARLFDRLATPSGKKIACFESDLAFWSGDLAPHLPELLKTLSDPDRRFLRRIESHDMKQYELYHDVLAHSVVSWTTRFRDREAKYEAERERAREIELGEAKRRARVLGAWLATVALGVIAFGIVAWQYTRMRRERETAERLAANFAAQQAVRNVSTTTTTETAPPAPVQMSVIPATATTPDADAARARDALDQARRHAAQKDFNGAAAAYQTAIDGFHNLDDRKNEADAQTGLAIAQRELGNGRAASDAFETAINLYAQLGEQHGLAEAYLQYGIYQVSLGKRDEALVLYAKAARLFEKTKDLSRLGAVLAQQGYALMQNADTEGAVRSLRAAADLQEGAADWPGLASTYVLLGTAYRRMGNPEDADRYYRKAHELQGKRR